MSHNFILLEAEEEEDSDEWNNSDGDEATRATAEIPSEYMLPSMHAPYRFDRMIQHMEESFHLREFVNARSGRVFPTVIPVSSARHKPLPPRIKPRRRSASVPPPAVSKMTTTKLRRARSTPPLGPVTRQTHVMSSSDMEASHGMNTGITADIAGSEVEQDLEMEDEVELTNDQRLLKHWIKKYMGAEELVAPGFRFFYVRCQPQFEQKIVDRICTDIQHRVIDPLILRAAFPSALPGGIYLQARSMLPQNTVLAAYLLTIPGFLYSKVPRFAFPVQELPHRISTTSARTDLVLPIHNSIDDPVGIQRILREPSHLDRYPPRSWIKCKRGLYKNDVGLVIADEFDEINSDVERLVLFPPRIDWELVPDFSSGKASLGKRKREPTERPAVLSRKGGVYIDQNYCFPTRMDCAKHCETPHSCSHSEATHKRYICLGQQWQNGLVLVRIKLADMELASEIPADNRYYFLESKHYAVQQSLLRMPPPSSWDFQIGEDVRFTDIDRVWCTPGGKHTFELPEGCTKGVIHHVGPSDCEISIPLQVANITVNSLHTMSKVHLEKIFFPGDTVKLLPGVRPRLRLHHETNEFGSLAKTEDIELAGNEGLVISVCPGRVEVLLQEGHNEKQILEFHPNTIRKVERSAAVHDVLSHHPTHLSAHQRRLPLIEPSTTQFPLKNVEVYPIKYSKKGYRAIVVDGKLNDDAVSGLSVQIRYETQGMNNSFAWVDYHLLRRVDNDCFLHDDNGSDEAGLHMKWDDYWRLKSGYSPAYSPEEQRDRKRRKVLEESALATGSTSDAGLTRATTPCSFNPPSPGTDPAWDPSSPDPSLQHWILDPRIVKSVQDKIELLVATTADPKQDQRIFLQTVNGVTGVYSNIGNRRRSPNCSDIVELNPWTILQIPRSYSVPSNPAIARGLYIICSGEHTGMLCRRVNYMMRLDPGKPSRWLVQVVKLIRKPKHRKGIQFDEIIDTDVGTIWIEGKDLATVHETVGMRTQGNKQLELIRSTYQPVHEL
ncbi:hypothetical protein FB446DRAFT_794937 [Lentinula raphanica]|nr:hypothetical protein FB446DRAFT_794937 [Lentinula raphanica]